MLLILVSIFVIVHKQDEVVFDQTVHNSVGNTKTNNDNDKNILDGCYHVYLDIGSNIGVQIRKLFEPEKLWNASIHRIFNTNFGNIKERRLAGIDNGRVVCAVGFEPNSHHTKYLKQIEYGYNNCGWRVKFMTETAVSDRNGTTKFYSDEAYNNMEWGGGILPPNINNIAVQPPKNDSKPKYHTVRLIKLSDFLNDVVGNRRLPVAYSKLHPPKVIMKMDIEGSEVDVLPDVIFRGGLQHINILMIEWHERLEMFAIRKLAQEKLKSVIYLLSNHSQIAKKNGGKFDLITLDIDDESYYKYKFKVPECKSPHDYVLD